MMTPCAQVNLTEKTEGLFNIASQYLSELMNCHSSNSAVNKLSIRFALPEQLDNETNTQPAQNCGGGGVARTVQVFLHPILTARSDTEGSYKFAIRVPCRCSPKHLQLLKSPARPCSSWYRSRSPSVSCSPCCRTFRPAIPVVPGGASARSSPTSAIGS